MCICIYIYIHSLLIERDEPTGQCEMPGPLFAGIDLDIPPAKTTALVTGHVVAVMMNCGSDGGFWLLV